MKKYIIAFLSVAIITSVFSLAIEKSSPILLLTILLAVFFIRLPSKIQSILIARVGIALLSIFSFFQIESYFFWAIHIRVIPDVYIIVTFLILIVFVLYRLLSNAQPKELLLQLKPSIKDLIILLPALIISGVMLIRVTLPKESNIVSVVKSVTYGMDDATHIRLLGDLMRTGSNLTTNRGIVYANKVSSTGAYPLGWHVTTSIVASSITKTDNLNSRDIVVIYFIAKILSLFGAIASFMFFLVILTDAMKLHIRHFFDVLTYIAVGIGISFMLILPLYFDGFFSFFPVVIYTMVFAGLYIQKSNKTQTLEAEILLCLFVIASAFTWLLTAPILAVALFLRYRHFFLTIKKIPLRFYLLLTIACFSILLQAYMLINDNIQISSLSTSGGIKSPSPFLLTATLLVYACFYIKERGYTNLRSTVSNLILPALFFLAAILLFISTKSQTITYYYYKMQVVILIMLMPIVCVYVIALIKNALSKKQTKGIILFALITILSIPSIIGYDYVSYIINRIEDTIVSDTIASKIVNTSLNESFSANNSLTYYLYPDLPSESILASNISRINYPDSFCSARMFDATYSGNVNVLANLAIKCSATTPMIDIYTNENNYNKLLTLIPKEYLDTKEIELIRLQ